MKVVLPAILISATAISVVYFWAPGDFVSNNNEGQVPASAVKPYIQAVQNTGDSPVEQQLSESDPLDSLSDPILSLKPLTTDLIERDMPDNVSDLRVRALNDDPDAAYDLYRIHASCTRNSTPDGCRTDEVSVDEAMSMLTMAAEANYWPAQAEYLRALYIFSGTPSQEEQDKGVAFLKAAVDSGSADAMFWLGSYSINGLDFTTTYESQNVIGGLSRVDAYAHFLAAAAVYKEAGIRANVVNYITQANSQFSPFEVMEARRRAELLLNNVECCKVWKH